MNTNTPTVLIVDDSPVNLGVVVENLERHGFEVLVALDGEEALDRIGMVRPDIVLLDVMMPGMDGFEVCRRLKAQSATQDIPVIFMTSLSGTQDKVAGFGLGAVDYVTKPLQIDEVKARVETHLRLRSLQRQLEERNVALQKEIAARKIAEMALVQRETEFRTLAENSPDILIRYDTDCRCTYANPAFARIAGKPDEFRLGAAPEDGGLFAAAWAQELRAAIRRVFAGSGPERIDGLEIGREGERRIFAMYLVPETDANGWVATVLAIGHDITERKRMEEHLRASEEQFRALAENAPDPIFRYDRNGCRIYVNPAAERISGMPADVLVGHSPADVSIIKEGGANGKLLRAIREVLDTGETVEVDIEYVSTTGRQYWFQTRLGPEKRPDGEIVGVVSIMRDVSEMRRLRQLVDEGHRASDDAG